MFEESKHPRDSDGKFTNKNNINQKTLQELKKEQTTTTAPKPIIIKTNNVEFYSKMAEAKKSIPADRRWRVDLHTLEDYKNDRLFITKDGSCVAIEPDGNIISVCKNEKSESLIRGKDLLKHAVENGGDRLDAFGENLYKIYVKCGFEPVSWTPFNKDYAPDGWQPEYGEEPVIFYKYTGKISNLSYEDFLNQVKPQTGDNGYDKAKNIRDGK